MRQVLTMPAYQNMPEPGHYQDLRLTQPLCGLMQDVPATHDGIVYTQGPPLLGVPQTFSAPQSMAAMDLNDSHPANETNEHPNEQVLSSYSRLSHGQITPNKSPHAESFYFGPDAREDHSLDINNGCDLQDEQHDVVQQASPEDVPTDSPVATPATHSGSQVNGNDASANSQEAGAAHQNNVQTRTGMPPAVFSSSMENAHGAAVSWSNPFNGQHVATAAWSGDMTTGLYPRGAPNMQSMPHMQQAMWFPGPPDARPYVSEPNIRYPGAVAGHQFAPMASPMPQYISPQYGPYFASQHEHGAEMDPHAAVAAAYRGYIGPAPPPQASRRRKRATDSQPQMSTEERREQNLRRNRDAAARCRSKKKVHDTEVEGMAGALEATNKALKIQRDKDQAELQELRKQIMDHCEFGAQCRRPGHISEWCHQNSSQEGRQRWSMLIGKPENSTEIAKLRANLSRAATDSTAAAASPAERDSRTATVSPSALVAEDEEE